MQEKERKGEAERKFRNGKEKGGQIERRKEKTKMRKIKKERKG